MALSNRAWLTTFLLLTVLMVPFAIWLLALGPAAMPGSRNAYLSILALCWGTITMLLIVTVSLAWLEIRRAIQEFATDNATAWNEEREKLVKELSRKFSEDDPKQD